MAAVVEYNFITELLQISVVVFRFLNEHISVILLVAFRACNQSVVRMFTDASKSTSSNTIQWVFSLAWMDWSSSRQCRLLAYVGLIEVWS